MEAGANTVSIGQLDNYLPGFPQAPLRWNLFQNYASRCYGQNDKDRQSYSYLPDVPVVSSPSFRILFHSPLAWFQSVKDKQLHDPQTALVQKGEWVQPSCAVGAPPSGSSPLPWELLVVRAPPSSENFPWKRCLCHDVGLFYAIKMWGPLGNVRCVYSLGDLRAFILS